MGISSMSVCRAERAIDDDERVSDRVHRRSNDQWDTPTSPLSLFDRPF
jgi:hypothetical protein